MKATRKRRTLLAASGLALLLISAGAAPSQADVLAPIRDRTSGSIETGGTGLDRSGDRSRFEEYRDVPENLPSLDALAVDLHPESGNFFVEFRAEDAIEDDQRYLFRLGWAGAWELEVRWDEVPHLLSVNGQSLLESQGGGVFTISDEVQRSLQEDPGRARLLLAAAPGTGLRSDLQSGSFAFRYTPTPRWELRLGTVLRQDDGTRPLGTAFTFAHVVEALYPVDSQTQEVRASAEYTRRPVSIRLGYEGSFFRNDLDAVVWDNPFRADDAAFDPSRGRLALAPDNEAHAITADGSLRLPGETTLVSMLSYGWRRQDAALLPFTINPAVESPALPTLRLDGEVRPTLASARLVTAALAPLSFEARFRLYDLANETPSVLFPDGYVRSDSLPGPVRRSLPYEYRQQRAGAGVSLPVARRGTVGLDADWTKTRRRFREVRDSDEWRVGPRTDLRFGRRISFHARYDHSRRDGGGYDPLAPEASFPEGEGVENARLRALRKFDLATRVRDELILRSWVTPMPRLRVGGIFSVAATDFPRTRYGLLDDLSISPSLVAVWAPVRWLQVSANYSFELHDYEQRSRERPIVQQGGQRIAIDDPMLDWTTSGSDLIHTFGLEGEAWLIPKRLSVTLDYTLSDAVENLETRGPNPRAADFPEISSRFQQLGVRFDYRLRRDTDLIFGYRFETFDQEDFAMTAIPGFGPVQPFMGDVDSDFDESAFLGAYAGDYTAQIGIVRIRYRW